MKMLITSLCFYTSKLHNVIVYFVCITGERGEAEATSATTTSGRGGGGDGGTIAAGILVPIIIIIIGISVAVAVFLLWRRRYIDKGSLSLFLSLSLSSLSLSPGGSPITLATSPSTMITMRTVGPLHQDLLNPPNRLSQPLRHLLLQFSTTSPMRGSSTNQTLLPEPVRLVSDLELCV